jgi:hypothetical protein
MAKLQAICYLAAQGLFEPERHNREENIRIEAHEGGGYDLCLRAKPDIASAEVNGYSTATAASGDASGDPSDPGVINYGTATSPLPTWIFQPGYNTGTWPLYFRFPTQKVLQVTGQAGLDVKYTRRLEELGTMSADLAYTFEYIDSRALE